MAELLIKDSVPMTSDFWTGSATSMLETIFVSDKFKMLVTNLGIQALTSGARSVISQFRQQYSKIVTNC